jgi:hypothetical protein
MRKTILAAVVASVALWMDVAAAPPDVSKLWNTSEQASGIAREWTDMWSPRTIELNAFTVFDESNRYQYTNVQLTRQSWGAVNNTGEGYIYWIRTLSCQIYDRGVLKVSKAGAELAATTLDPTSPDCSNSGYRIDCDADWNCVYDWNYRFNGSRVVQGRWLRPLSTESATSTVHGEYNYFYPQRVNRVCKTFVGQNLSGTLSMEQFTYDQNAEGVIYQTHCEMTQQASP